MTLPSSLEVYEPEHKVNVTTKLSGMQGSISDSYTVVPTYQGKYPIPGISFSYFDPKTETYKTIASKEIIIDVTDGPVSSYQSQSVVASTPGKQPVLTSGNQFSSFKTKANFVRTEPNIFFKTKLFWASLIAPFLAIPVAILVRRRNETKQNDVIGNRLRRANKLAKKYLSAAKRTLGDKEAFYDALERSLHNYLKAKLNIETSEFSKEKIVELLEGKSVDALKTEEFINLLRNCEIARYTPFSNVEMQQDYDLAAEVITVLDKQFR